MSINIYVYWGPRKRTAEELILQLQAHFQALNQADQRLASWAPLGRSLKKAMASEPVDVSSAALLHSLLLRGQNRTDMPPRQPIPELGYRITLWNQRRGNMESSTSVHGGAHSEYLSKDSQNNASLELTYMAGAEPLASQTLLGLFNQLIDVWKPDWGSIWRYVNKGHPAGTREDPTRVQYAFYRSRAGLGPGAQTAGNELALTGGSMWVDGSVASALEGI